MAGEETTNQGAININHNIAVTGLNMDQSVNQIAKGSLTYALNAAVENFDANSVNYQNEQGNEFCLSFPEGYQLIGKHSIYEKNKHIFFLANPDTGDSEIGYMDNNDCGYKTLVNAKCLNFSIYHPIHKVVHKITNCTTEIYWTDGFNSRRFLDIENLPYKLASSSNLCDPVYTNELDCNKLNMQPIFNIPNLKVVDVNNGGNLTAGTYQFAIQYSSAEGDAYTSYYSVTNPTPIANPQITTSDFNYPVGKSIDVEISNIDVNGTFQYFNLAVIKTVNAITSVELVGTYFIDDSTKRITYTGQNVTQIRLTINDIFEKFPYYEIANDVTAVQDVLIWNNLTSVDRINYQGIANQIQLQWETYRIPSTENYADELNATNLRGYLRDEVYAFEIVFLLKNGKQTDGFHIPGRTAFGSDLALIPETNNDFIGDPEEFISGVGYSPYWKIYNTASVTAFSPDYSPSTNYKGPYQYGEFAYWESIEEYPCNAEVWGSLAGQKIRHHKFPDVLVSPIFESPTFTLGPGFSPVMQNDAIFPIGVKINVAQVRSLINTSSLTQEQKDNIVGFKIVRGDRSTNSSIVAKGILRNVGKYEREGNEYYFPNYPYNDLRQDPFLLTKNNAFVTKDDDYSTIEGYCRSFNVTGYDNTLPLGSKIEYVNCYTGETNTIFVEFGVTKTFCALGTPIVVEGKACITSNTYKTYKIEMISSVFSFVLKVAYPEGIGNDVITALPCSPFPASPCDFCNTNPTDDCCINSTIVKGKYVLFPLSFTGVPGTTITVNSIVKPIPFNAAIEENVDYKLTVLASYGQTTCAPTPLEAFNTDNSKYRHIFNSPETSFGTPFLGNVLKLENVIFGAGSAHFTQVKKNAMYKLLSKEAQEDALKSSSDIANIGGPPSNVSALFAAYQSYLTIYVNGITRRNYGWSFNSIASYDYSSIIGNNINIAPGNFGIKQRPLEIAQYLIPGVLSVGDDNNINNFQRESSVYLKTDLNKTPLPFPNQTPSINGAFSDDSRFTLSSSPIVTHCNTPEENAKTNVISYYASLKNIFDNQWGQIYSYDTLDTGFQRIIPSSLNPTYETFFGGDTFICKFAFKTKLPFFIDNRVGAPDDSDIFYDEIGNVAYPKYWHSARSVLYDGIGAGVVLKNFISVKARNLDCPNKQTPEDAPGRTFYDGKMYMFAYGIPYFYCESSYNIDLRQAFNNKEGDFWPHVSTDIPDDWVQESFVSIANDNTYYYNTTFSKQNRENFFSHLPPDWEQKLCLTVFPFRAIYSDRQLNFTTNQVNNWLVYRPTSSFDFPQNYGDLISLDGIQNRAILARFENKSLLYNTLLTVETSNPQAAYLGNDTLFRSAPPIDFAETDLGYVGCQNKMLLKIPQGQITIDAKRGQIFLISGNQATDLTAFGSGMNRFFTDHLAFEILRYFPDVDIDNHFNGIGIHGVFDSKFERIIITKLDYIPLNKNIKYDATKKEFYLETVIPQVPTTTSTTTILGSTTTSTTTSGGTTSTTTTMMPLIHREVVYLEDTQYFCNKSWTLSYNLNTRSWISFHSYIPNWYIAENNFFYSGSNDCCTDFQAVVAVPVPEPSTSTTTTTTTVPQTICFCIHIEAVGCGIQYEIPTSGNDSPFNGRPTYDFSALLGYPASVYYNGTNWVFFNSSLGLTQPLSNSNYYPIGDVIDWGDTSVTFLMNSSVFGPCPTTTTTTTVAPECECFLGENLNVTTYRNGDLIPEVTDPTAWASLTTGAWCHYNNDPANEPIYGKLYNWYAVNDPRGLAPLGYTIPTKQDWDDLISCLGGRFVAGGKMKATGTLEGGTGLWLAPNTGATNDMGTCNTCPFNGLPGGFRNGIGAFTSINEVGKWWSATQIDTLQAYDTDVVYNNSNATSFNPNFKTCGFSIRLKKEDCSTITTTSTTTTSSEGVHTIYTYFTTL